MERADHGIFVVRIRSDVDQSVADADANLEAAFAAAGGRAPLLVDIRLARPLTPETRHRYSGRNLNHLFTALGLLVDASPYGRMFGNVYLRLARPGIPARLFSTEADAILWLRPFQP